MTRLDPTGPEPLSDAELRERWKRVFIELNANSHYAPGRDDYFRFEVVDTGRTGSELIVHAFFKAGERYCCGQVLCSFRLWPEHWPAIRRLMEMHGLGHLPTVCIREWRVTYERGCAFHLGRMNANAPLLEEASSERHGPFIEFEGLFEIYTR